MELAPNYEKVKYQNYLHHDPMTHFAEVAVSRSCFQFWPPREFNDILQWICLLEHNSDYVL